MAFYPSELAADDASTPINAWSGSLTNPAAYGSVPAPTQPVSTSGAATGNAIAAGQEVNSQLPGYTQDLSNVGANITALTSGQVPGDVIEQLQQQGAEENAVTGAGSNAAYLKALGLTSLGLDQTGQQDLQSILTSLPGQAISQNPEFQPTTGQTLRCGPEQRGIGSRSESGSRRARDSPRLAPATTSAQVQRHRPVLARQRYQPRRPLPLHGQHSPAWPMARG